MSFQKYFLSLNKHAENAILWTPNGAEDIKLDFSYWEKEDSNFKNVNFIHNSFNWYS